MTTAALRICGSLFLIWAAGCAGPVPSPSATSEREGLRPIAPDIVPVSKSHPSVEAQEALDECYITDFKHTGFRTLGLDSVAGMGEVVPARDAPLYVPLVGIEPEIQTDGPAWLIETKGVVTLALAPTMRNPTCVVVRGVSSWYATDAYSEGNGWVTARPVPLPPSFRLPPLAP
jgi:hypothetical protein